MKTSNPDDGAHGHLKSLNIFVHCSPWNIIDETSHVLSEHSWNNKSKEIPTAEMTFIRLETKSP